MKFNYLSALFRSVGILLIACAASAAMASVPQTVVIPNFVKHNQGRQPTTAATPASVSAAPETSGTPSTPTIAVDVAADPSDSTKLCIKYSITDENRQPGHDHKKCNTNNESTNSTLFTTTGVNANSVNVLPTYDGEVLIVYVDQNGKYWIWKSDCKIYSDSNMKDGDVRWIDLVQ